MASWFQAQTLTGQFVRLEPLTPAHYPLILAGLEPEAFTYMNPDPLRSPEALAAGTVLADIKRTRLAFVTINLADGRLAGSTSFYLLREDSRTVEIGGTWVKRAYQGSCVNTEAKYLMFKHAFEVWQTIRVQIRTHDKNVQSKRALGKLGLVKEGVIRNESIFKDGNYRDTALYSVIKSEWAETKGRLEHHLYG